MFNMQIITIMDDDKRLSSQLREALKDAYYLKVNNSSAIWNLFTQSDPNICGDDHYKDSYINNMRII